MPQLRKSSAVDVQPVEHVWSPLQAPPVAGGSTQTPPMQTSPAVQAWPQPPQSLTPRMKSAQYVLADGPGHTLGAMPLHGWAAPPSNGIAPASVLVLIMHWPAMQPPLGQTLPQAPQLRGSPMRLVQIGFWPFGSRHCVPPAPQFIAGKSVQSAPWQ